MAANILPTQPFNVQPPHQPSLEEVSRRLELDIAYCTKMLELGQSVELVGNIDQRYGAKMVGSYFEAQLEMSVNRRDDITQRVQVTDYNGSGKTVVQLVSGIAHYQDMPTTVDTQLATSGAAKQLTTTKHHGVAVRKNPPRPMNCWMLFRDTRHKELKDADPNLTVQVISSICSNDWKHMSQAQKDEWREKAQAAKEEHQRMYPDYKYTPRKPGQKKKRQSRKSKRDGRKSPRPGADFDNVFDFNSFSSPVPTTEGISNNIGGSNNVIMWSGAEDAGQEVGDVLGGSFDSFMDDLYFRTGANMDATLTPTFTLDSGLF